MLDAMPFNELRQARGLSQKMPADALHVQQPANAKMEKRTALYLSTLRSHIEAMGGQLEVVARLPDGVVSINNFPKLDQAALTCPIAVTRCGEAVPHQFKLPAQKPTSN